MKINHVDFISCPVILPAGCNGMCSLNAAILCLLEEELSPGSTLGGCKSPRSEAMESRNSLGWIRPSSRGWGWQTERGHGHKEINFAQPTRVWSKANLSLSCLWDRFLCWRSLWHQDGLWLPLLGFPVRGSWKIERTSSVFRHGKPW